MIKIAKNMLKYTLHPQQPLLQSLADVATSAFATLTLKGQLNVIAYIMGLFLEVTDPPDQQSPSSKMTRSECKKLLYYAGLYMAYMLTNRLRERSMTCGEGRRGNKIFPSRRRIDEEIEQLVNNRLPESRSIRKNTLYWLIDFTNEFTSVASCNATPMNFALHINSYVTAWLSLYSNNEIERYILILYPKYDSKSAIVKPKKCRRKDHMMRMHYARKARQEAAATMDGEPVLDSIARLSYANRKARLQERIARYNAASDIANFGFIDEPRIFAEPSEGVITNNWFGYGVYNMRWGDRPDVPDAIDADIADDE